LDCRTDADKEHERKQEKSAFQDPKRADALLVSSIRDHMQVANNAFQELHRYATIKPKPDELIKLADGREVAVGQRCRELQNLVKTEMPLAKAGTDSFLQDEKQRKPGDTRTTAREDLASFKKADYETLSNVLLRYPQSASKEAIEAAKQEAQGDKQILSGLNKLQHYKNSVTQLPGRVIYLP